MPYIYILRCADDSYYIGSTDDLEQRLREHRDGVGARHTASRLPVELVYCEYADSSEESFIQDRQVQDWPQERNESALPGGFGGPYPQEASSRQGG